MIGPCPSGPASRRFGSGRGAICGVSVPLLVAIWGCGPAAPPASRPSATKGAARIWASRRPPSRGAAAAGPAFEKEAKGPLETIQRALDARARVEMEVSTVVAAIRDALGGAGALTPGLGTLGCRERVEYVRHLFAQARRLGVAGPIVDRVGGDLPSRMRRWLRELDRLDAVLHASAASISQGK